MDSFSPLSAARMLVQVLPVGQITIDVLKNTITKLRDAGPLSLKSLPVPSNSGGDQFNPQKFPLGKISFFFTSSSKSLSHAVLYPFETFREPLIVLGIVDGSKHDFSPVPEPSQVPTTSEGRTTAMELSQALAQLHDNYPNALIHQLLIVDNDNVLGQKSLPEGAFLLTQNDGPEKLLQQLAANALLEMAGLAKSFQVLQQFPSPLSQSQSDDLGPASPSLFSRRNSLHPTPASAGRLNDVKAAHRMSMPAHLVSSRPLDSEGDVESSSADGRSVPATTFDDIPEAASGASSRVSTPPPQLISKESSKDRNTVAGFGSGVLNERNRTKQQARLACLIGTLYLQSGLWVDALRELTDSAVKAKSGSDYLWQAKALENLTICMLLLAANGATLKIPNICQPASFRPLAGRRPPSPTNNDSVEVARSPEEIIEAMRGLYEILPELIQMIRDLYRRTQDVPGEALPAFAYSEINVRFARLLIGLSDRGHMDEGMKTLLQGVLGDKLPRFSRGKTFARQINDILQYSMPPPADFTDITMLDVLSILGAIAASYAAVNMLRKSTLILQDFLDCLVPGLVQARKVGAAEAGMHPAAGIANLQVQPTDAATMKLDDILSFFSCIDLMPLTSKESKEPIFRKETMSGLTNIETKMILLRKCVKVCEALPDFEAIMKCTAHLFALAGPGMAPVLPLQDVHVTLSPEEQAMLSGNLYRTSDLVDNLGLPCDGGDYWDPFLVRGVELQPPPAALEMQPHRMTDFGVTDSGNISTGPFLHDAFAHKNKGRSSKPVIVVGEAATFYVSLQNLFDFEVYIDSMELVTDTGALEARVEDIVIGSRAALAFPVAGVAKAAGDLRITGCRVAPKACREAVFEIVAEPWSAQGVTKIGERPAKFPDSRAGPKFSTFDITVLEAQPLLGILEVDLFQRAIDIMDGERKQIKLTLVNQASATVNFVKVSSQDNIKLYLQNALKDRDLPPPVRYEMERQVYQIPAVRCITGLDREELAPKNTATFEFEVFGRQGLSQATLQVNYGFVPEDARRGLFFTRLVQVPFTVVVMPSIRALSCHISPVSRDTTDVEGSYTSAVWLAMDFKNLSRALLQVRFDKNGRKTSQGASRLQQLLEEQVIQPGRVSSSFQLVRKMYVDKPHATIPSLDPTKERQFVIRQSGGVPIDEREERERFWYTKSLIESLSASWTDVETGRSGEINLQELSLTDNELQLLKLNEIDINWTNELTGTLNGVSTAVLIISNRSQNDVRAEVHLHQTTGKFLDRSSDSSTETQLLPVLRPGSATEVRFDCTFESKGLHIFVPSIVEIVPPVGDRTGHLRTWNGEARHVYVD